MTSLRKTSRETRVVDPLAFALLTLKGYSAEDVTEAWQAAEAATPRLADQRPRPGAISDVRPVRDAGWALKAGVQRFAVFEYRLPDFTSDTDLAAMSNLTATPVETLRALAMEAVR